MKNKEGEHLIDLTRRRTFSNGEFAFVSLQKNRRQTIFFMENGNQILMFIDGETSQTSIFHAAIETFFSDNDFFFFR